MPARRDIDPSEIRSLLPHIALVERDQEFYRWRLMGTAIAADMGRDLTGQKYGAYISGSEFLKAMCRTLDDVLASARPVFDEAVYKKDERTIHSVSRLLLPLATNGGTPALVLMSRITRFSPNLRSERNWLKSVPGRVYATHPVDRLEELENRAMAWERATRFGDKDDV